MNEIIAVSAICFVISGWGIPIYCPSIAMDRWESVKWRLFAGGSLAAWALSLSYGVTFVLHAAR